MQVRLSCLLNASETLSCLLNASETLSCLSNASETLSCLLNTIEDSDQTGLCSHANFHDFLFASSDGLVLAS